jgi:hypothetical protein
MANEMTAKMFEHIDFAGQYRFFCKDIPSFLKESFNDMVSSIIVYKGSSYKSGDIVRFCEHDGYGGGLLQPGNFRPGTKIPDLTVNPYVFNDKISSLRIS